MVHQEDPKVGLEFMRCDGKDAVKVRRGFRMQHRPVTYGKRTREGGLGRETLELQHHALSLAESNP